MIPAEVLGITDVLKVRPAAVLSPAQIAAAKLAQNRRWMLKAWLLSVLPGDEMARLMTAPMPPTIGELHALARQRAEEHAGKCASCGAVLPIAGATALHRAKRKSRRAKRG